MARLDWYGDRIAKKTEAASIIAIDETMAECVTEAKLNHPWHNVTGFEEGSIQMLPGESTGAPGATVKGTLVSGRWGALANYSLFLEIGTSRADSGAPRAQVRAAAAGGDMSAISPPLPVDDPLMAPRPYLRPAADAQYPLLAMRIRNAIATLP